MGYSFLSLRERERSAPQLRNAFIPCAQGCLKRRLRCFQLGLRLVDRALAHDTARNILKLTTVLTNALSAEASLPRFFRQGNSQTTGRFKGAFARMPMAPISAGRF